MNLEKIDKNNTSIIKYSKTDNVLNDICSIINSARDYAFQSVNLALVERNWLIGYRIVDTVSRQSRALLSWSHYRTLLQVFDKEAREWYEKEALGQTWSVRTLQRNISSQYYYRLLKSQVKEPVIEEMKKVNENQHLMNKLEFVKNPVIAEFLGYSLDDSFTETELETSIISNLQKFLMELRKRLCFCRKTTTYSY